MLPSGAARALLGNCRGATTAAWLRYLFVCISVWKWSKQVAPGCERDLRGKWGRVQDEFPCAQCIIRHIHPNYSLKGSGKNMGAYVRVGLGVKMFEHQVVTNRKVFLLAPWQGLRILRVAWGMKSEPFLWFEFLCASVAASHPLPSISSKNSLVWSHSPSLEGDIAWYCISSLLPQIRNICTRNHARCKSHFCYADVPSIVFTSPFFFWSVFVYFLPGTNNPIHRNPVATSLASQRAKVSILGIPAGTLGVWKYLKIVVSRSCWCFKARESWPSTPEAYGKMSYVWQGINCLGLVRKGFFFCAFCGDSRRNM